MKNFRRFFLVNLGCPKNLVDSERISLELIKRGFSPAHSPENADIIIVNTCGFISDARKMSEQHINHLANFRNGEKKLVVLGCFPQRIGIENAKRVLPADFIFGAGGDEFIKFIDSELAKNQDESFEAEVKKKKWKNKLRKMNITSAADDDILSVKSHGKFGNKYDGVLRLNTLSPFSAYVKISEGCSRSCSFCSIPFIRGPLRSKDEESILREIRYLAETGVREFILISQDTTMWGRDRQESKREELFKLLDRISEIDGVEWIRLFYIYPDTFAEKLIDYIAGNPKIVRYIEIPFQHVDDEILRKMGRATREKTIRKIMDKIREKIPDMSVRTELIVGFPGENSEKFEKLLRFVEEYEFDWLGVFTYSPEPGTPSFKMWLDEIGINDGISERTQWFLEESYIRKFQVGDGDDVMNDDRDEGSEDEFIGGKSNAMEIEYGKDFEERLKRFFVEAESKKREVIELWSHIFARKQMDRVGKVFRCIFEEGRTFRAYFQAPEVDGVVRVRKGLDVRNLYDAFRNIKIVGVDGTDLIGEIV